MSQPTYYSYSQYLERIKCCGNNQPKLLFRRIGMQGYPGYIGSSGCVSAAKIQCSDAGFSVTPLASTIQGGSKSIS